jgi:beta-aspartyl-peptidase (threonine type)
MRNWLRFQEELMRNRIVTCGWAFLVIAAISTLAVNSTDAHVKLSVEQVLRNQQAAWNRHDLQGFMAGYWNSPELTFFSGAQRMTGWQAAMDRYVRNYQSEGKEMGKLEFSNLQIEALSADSVFVRGAWHLTMSDGKTPHGLFTLVFRKFPEGWKIVHDHTAAE